MRISISVDETRSMARILLATVVLSLVAIASHAQNFTVVEGRAIGHKRIDHFLPVKATRVRLNTLSSSAEAHIREFQIFNDKKLHPAM